MKDDLKFQPLYKGWSLAAWERHYEKMLDLRGNIATKILWQKLNGIPPNRDQLWLHEHYDEMVAIARKAVREMTTYPNRLFHKFS